MNQRITGAVVEDYSSPADGQPHVLNEEKVT